MTSTTAHSPHPSRPSIRHVPLAHRGQQSFAVVVTGQPVRALGQKSLGNGLAQTAGRAGDKDYFVGKLIHCFLLRKNLSISQSQFYGGDCEIERLSNHLFHIKLSGPTTVAAAASLPDRISASRVVKP